MTDTFEPIAVHMPHPGELGIGAGKLYSDGEFHSIVWFPADAREDAEDFIAGGDWVLRDNVPF
jgi:hypothetical protein